MKTIFKISALLFFLFTTLEISAQPPRFFLGYSQDLKMAIDGPGHSYDIDHSNNYEISAGINVDLSEIYGLRIATAYEGHPAIGYQKWTLVKTDFVFKNSLLFWKLDNFNQLAGLEISTIYRADQLHYNTEDSVSAGLNLALQYDFKLFILEAGFNYFAAEAALIRDNKKMRYDVMISIIVEITELTR
tara:strand:+ start:1231 stop:1794 length:564 start_codon:yes stop_codon:yes gene_type:complete